MPITKTVTIPLSDVNVSGESTAAAFIKVRLLDHETDVQAAQNFALPAAGTASMSVSVTAPNPGNYTLRSQAVAADGTTAVTPVRNQPVSFVADQVFAAPTPAA